MDDAVREDICDQFCDGLSLTDTRERDRSPISLIRNALASLADPDEWFYASNEGTESPPVALLLAGDFLAEVLVWRDEDDEVRFLATTRPLLNSGTVVSVEWGNRETSDQGVYFHTTWVFKFADGSSILVPGLVQTKPEESLDRGEEFARTVADRLGEVVEPR